MLWAVFNNLKNSSTRCEIAGTLVGMIPEGGTQMGVDHSAVVGKGTKIITHQRKRAEATLRNQDGGLILGGTSTPLHRESPFKRRWHTMKDGDLWKMFQDFVKWKGPWSVWLSKVKGHATQEQVDNGEVRAEDKKGTTSRTKLREEAPKISRNS